jgi:hypothetical protein
METTGPHGSKTLFIDKDGIDAVRNRLRAIVSIMLRKLKTDEWQLRSSGVPRKYIRYIIQRSDGEQEAKFAEFADAQAKLSMLADELYAPPFGSCLYKVRAVDIRNGTEGEVFSLKLLQKFLPSGGETRKRKMEEDVYDNREASKGCRRLEYYFTSKMQ